MTLNSQTTVRDLLTNHPEAFGILAGHGMCEDCKHNPPPVPLQHFAAKHCGGNTEGLIRELQGAIEAS